MPETPPKTELPKSYEPAAIEARWAEGQSAANEMRQAEEEWGR